jgi:hypothetical protein
MDKSLRVAIVIPSVRHERYKCSNDPRLPQAPTHNMNKYILVAIAIVLLIRYILYHRRDGAGHPLPPGPTGLPLLGNIFNFPKKRAWLLAGKWRKKYGD